MTKILLYSSSLLVKHTLGVASYMSCVICIEILFNLGYKGCSAKIGQWQHHFHFDFGGSVSFCFGGGYTSNTWQYLCLDP